jgi:hypothetical protein
LLGLGTVVWRRVDSSAIALPSCWRLAQPWVKPPEKAGVRRNFLVLRLTWVMRDRTGEGETPAIESDGIRTGLRRHLAVSFGVTLVGVALLAVFAVMALSSGSRNDRLERNGVEADGRIIGLDPTAGLTIGAVDVEFRLQDRLRQERVFLNSDSPRYDVGQSVTVLVDPNDPEVVTIAGESNNPPAFVWPMVFALVLGFLASLSGATAIHQNWRKRRILTEHPWRTVAIDYRDAPGRRKLTTRPFVRLSERRSDTVLRLAEAPTQRIKKSGLPSVDHAQVASDDKRRYVLRPVGSDTTFLARAPKRERQRRYWCAHFDDDQATLAER